MKNINEIHLEDIADNLNTAHVKLDLEFLNRLLKDASKCDKPWRNVEFAEKIGSKVNKDTNSAIGINSWMNGRGTIPIFKLIKIVALSNYTWGDVEANLISIKAGRKKGEIRTHFPLEIDYKFGLLVGHILGDGSINKRGESVFFSNTNPELLKEFIDCMLEKFGATPRIWVQKISRYEEKREWLKRIKSLDEIPENNPVGIFYPKICVNIIKAIFGNFADGKEKKMTQEIKNSSFEFKRGLVRAFFDDEGTVYKNRTSIRFFQDRREILESIRTILQEFNINSEEIKCYMKRNKKRYYFTISNYRDCFSYYIKIGCSSSAKHERLASSIYNLRNGRQRKYIRRMELSV